MQQPHPNVISLSKLHLVISFQPSRDSTGGYTHNSREIILLPDQRNQCLSKKNQPTGEGFATKPMYKREEETRGIPFHLDDNKYSKIPFSNSKVTNEAKESHFVHIPKTMLCKMGQVGL